MTQEEITSIFTRCSQASISEILEDYPELTIEEIFTARDAAHFESNPSLLPRLAHSQA